MRNWWLGFQVVACGVGIVACGQTDTAGTRPSAAGGENAIASPSQCSGFVDDMGGALTVRIVNETTETLHLGQQMVTCNTDPVFVVKAPDGKVLGRPGNCHNCSTVVTTGMAGCPTNCPQPLAVTLEPGESTEAAWDGVFSTSVDIPKECVKKDPLNIEITQCFLNKRIAAGVYKFSAAASKTLACGATSGTCSECRPRDGGGCETPQGVIGAPELTAETDVGIGDGPTFGQDAPIELVFRD